MAWMQSCCRSIIVRNSLKFTNKNGVLLQSTRRQHFLVFQMAPTKNTHIYRKSQLLSNSHVKHLFRLASTNVTSRDSAKGVVEMGASPNTGEGVVSVNLALEDSSKSNILIDEASLPPVPEPPLVEMAQSNVSPEVFDFVSMGLKEPTFQSLGLGHWWPSGILQQGLEFLHINLDLPWWAAIATVTVIFRVMLLPVAASARKNAVNTSNNSPEFQRLMQKMTEARERGNYYEAALCTQELQMFIKEKGILGFQTFAPVFLQAPIFFFMYRALSGMANAPVESMKTGGLFWFTDLTVPDPYYVLPVFLASSLFIILEIGAEGPSSAGMSQKSRMFLRVIPLIVLPITISFPSALTWYWSVSNILTFGQLFFFKIPAVAKFFNIPKQIVHPKTVLQKEKKPFIQGFKDSYTNMKIAAEIADRERLNTVKFEKAGAEPVPRTFKTNPKKMR